MVIFWRYLCLFLIICVAFSIEIKPWLEKHISPEIYHNVTVVTEVLEEFIEKNKVVLTESEKQKVVDILIKNTLEVIGKKLPKGLSYELLRDVDAELHNKLFMSNSDNLFENASDKKCYALVLSGGSNRGAWEAAVVRGIVEKYRSSNLTVRWDVVSGVSVGAMNAFSSLFYEDSYEWSVDLWNFWWSAPQETLSDCRLPIKKNIISWMRQLLRRIFDPSAVFRFLCGTKNPRKRLGHSFAYRPRAKNKSVAITATRYEDGLYRTWYGWNQTNSELLDATFASLAYPLVFSPVYINGSYYMDGGIQGNCNILEAIRHCMEIKNVSSENVVVDFIETLPLRPEYYTDSTPLNIRLLINRAFDLLHYNVRGLKMLQEAMTLYPNVFYRHFPTPRAWSELYEWPSLALDISDRTRMFQMMKSGLSVGWNTLFLNTSKIRFNSTLDNLLIN